MKALFRTGLFVFLALVFTGRLNAQCTNAPEGQWPSTTVALNVSSNAIVQLTDCAFTGEYSVVSNVQTGKSYTVTSSTATNYITVTLTDGTTVIAHGLQPLTFTATSSANLRIYRHDNAACGVTASGCRVINMNCNDCAVVLPPPANDNCAGAITLTHGTTCTTTAGTTANATQSQAGCSLSTADDDVWYQFVATATSAQVIVTGAASFDAVVQAFSGTCGSLVAIGACQDVTFSGGTETLALSGLMVGTTYYVRTYHYNSSVSTTPTFTICVTTPPPPPANDNCSAATSLTVNADLNCGVTTAGTTVSATASVETAPSCSATGVNDDVWYSFTATGTAHQVRITGATNTTAIAVYTGSCGALTQISLACASTSSGTATLNLTGLTAATTYRVRVYTTSSTVGTSATFTMCVGTPPPPPANDNCAGAIAFPTIPSDGTCATLTGNTVSATQSQAACVGSGADDDIWFSFVAPASTVIAELTAISGNADRVHQIFSGTCGSLVSVTCSDPETSTTTGLTVGATYYVRVHTYFTGTSTEFSLCLKVPPPPPANDACANAVLISGCQSVSGTTIGATGDGLTTTCGTTVTATLQGVWYRFVGDGNPVEVNTCGGAAFDTKIQVLSGSCGSFTCVAGNDDFCSLQSRVTWNSTMGVTYYIYVYPLSNPGGNFVLNLISGPPCLAPAPVTGSIGTNNASISWPAVAGATNYTYSFGTGVHTCGTGAVSQAGTSVNLSGLIPNTTYTFCVRTNCSCGSSSYATIMFTTLPLPNDNCAGAQTITCGSTINGSTVGASSDAALGSCGIGTGGTPTNGVWYKLVGNGGQVTASLCGSAYNTKLHVYTGTCAGLTCLVSNDDAACGAQSQVVFNANVGTDYYILVNGSGSATGAFSLNLTCLCGPPLGAPWTVTNIGNTNGGAIENVCDGTIDVRATGFTTPTSDVQTYAWQQLCGNGFIKAKVENVINGGWGGIMFRENNAAGSKKVALRTQLATMIFRDVRATTNGAVQQQQLPRPGAMWLRITRTGNNFVGESSVNGVNWDVAFTITMVLPSCIEVGLFAQSANVNTTTTAVFSNVMGVPTSPPVIPLVAADNDNTATQEVLSLFPNPASDEINVKMEAFYGKNVTISVQNQLGQVMLLREIDEVQDATERIELNTLPSGIYTLTLRTAGQAPLSKQFMVGSTRP